MKEEEVSSEAIPLLGFQITTFRALLHLKQTSMLRPVHYEMNSTFCLNFAKGKVLPYPLTKPNHIKQKP